MEKRIAAPFHRINVSEVEIMWSREVKFFQVRKLDQNCQNLLWEGLMLVR